MSGGLLQNTAAGRPNQSARTSSQEQGLGIAQQLVRIGRSTGRTLVSPLRLMLSIRRSMTSASTILMLVGIATTNIIWGYPWIGVFSASASLFFVGWTLNRLSAPRLEIDYSLPRSAPAGQTFPLQIHIANRSRLPGMDLDIGFDNVDPQGIRSAAQGKSEWVPFASIDMLRPEERTGIATTLQFHRRGTHQLPALIASSVFPFHLFRSKRSYPSGVEITITPKPLTKDDDGSASGLLDVAGNWSRRLLAGDALDYTGSREYQYGMPVRRWDFTSWARLGRPIVREFQSPSVRTVTLIVDTSADQSTANSKLDIDPLAERVLSMTATILHQLGRPNIRIRLFVTGESGSTIDDESIATHDLESLLIRLGAASYVSRSEGADRIEAIIARIGVEPALVLSGRGLDEFKHGLPDNTQMLRVALPAEHRSSGQHKRRRGRQRARTAAIGSQS